MQKSIPLYLSVCLFVISCASVSKKTNNDPGRSIVKEIGPDLAADAKPVSMMDLSRTENGAFILAPGFYEAEFKTYCLQPGTPDPSPRDAYLQAPVAGYRKEIVKTILYNSREKSFLDQKNVQLLLWSVVSGSDFNKLSSPVRSTAAQLLTSKQIFELQGGVMGVIKTVSANMPAIGSNREFNRLFEMGANSYEAFERIAVLRQPAEITRPEIRNDQWYKQKEKYFVRYFPQGYQKTRVQVYVPAGVLDSMNMRDGEYIVYDPTGLQAIPANSNAQRLGVGGPILDIIKEVIRINKPIVTPKKSPEPPKQKGPKSIS